MSLRIKIGTNALMSMEVHWLVVSIHVATIAAVKPNVSHNSNSRSRIVRARWLRKIIDTKIWFELLNLEKLSCWMPLRCLQMWWCHYNNDFDGDNYNSINDEESSTYAEYVRFKKCSNGYWIQWWVTFLDFNNCRRNSVIQLLAEFPYSHLFFTVTL